MALMFESLTTRLNGVLDRLKRRGALSEDDVVEAMREIRIALLEADVALPVVKDLVARVRERAVGQEVIKSVTPGQMVVKIVHDELVAILGARGQRAQPRRAARGRPDGRPAGLGQDHDQRQARPPAARSRSARRCCWPRSTRSARPPRCSSRCWPASARSRACRSSPASRRSTITRRALETARREGFDVLILDTAGRLQHRRRADGRAGRRSATSPGRTRPCWSPTR